MSFERPCCYSQHRSRRLCLSIRKVMEIKWWKELIVQGCLELMSRSGISIKGKKAVIVGRSNIVGLPVSLLLLKADATVTVVHSCTPDPESFIREADIIIAAAG
ncbi:hypothetical protein ACFX1R_036545 [Malus domestica]